MARLAAAAANYSLAASSWRANPPRLVLALAANAYTQYACIRGVNRLAARSSALTVTVVLNVRKLASLLLSVWLFGHRLAPGVAAGAAVVFAAGALYAWEGQGQRQREGGRASGEAGKEAGVSGRESGKGEEAEAEADGRGDGGGWAGERRMGG